MAGKKPAGKPIEAILIPELKRQEVLVPIRGNQLIVHRFSEKAKKEIRDKQGHKAKEPRGPKNPKKLFEASMYYFDDGKRYGIPALAFKKACVAACRYIDGINMTYARGAFFINGEYSKQAGYPLVELVKYEGPFMREDPVTVGRGTDLRYRAEFRNWEAILNVTLLTQLLSVEQFYNLLEIAGLCVGVLEWRPAKDGDFGQFEIMRKEQKAA